VIPALVPLLLTLRRRALIERRKGRSARFVVWSMLSGVLLAISAAWIAAFFYTLIAVGLWWLGIVFALLVFYSYFPWAAARSIAIPLGRPRLAYYLAAESRDVGEDRIGAGLVAAAWALCRQRAPSLDDAAWIDARRDAGGRLGDTRVVATALSLAARGDRDAARTLLESVALLPEVTPWARELAGEWLAADDAERGCWRRILERAPRRAHAQLAVDGGAFGLPAEVEQVRRPTSHDEQLWPATPLTFFLEGVAARLAGIPDAPGDAALFLRWLEAPRRHATWGLYQRATATARSSEGEAPPAAPAAPVEPTASDPVGAAVGAHVAALDAHARGALERRHVVAAATAWDRALSSEGARTGILARAIDVGAPADAGHRVLDEVARTAADDLAMLVLAASLPVAELRAGANGVLASAVQRVRHRLLGDLELAVSRTAERVRARRALPAIDEWRELLALRLAHRRAVDVGGDELRRLGFPHLHTELTPWLVWLWNERREHALSDALTTWLLAEALAVGDAQAIETHARNASMPLPSRQAR